jgi:mRNA-degrading endonuclease RelE of RelBE toxin-antitoxin system
VTLYKVKRLPEVDRDTERLPLALKRRFRDSLEYLRSAPYRSYPWLQVKELRDMRGVWRFHLDGRTRVFYVVRGDVLIVVMVERNAGVTRRTLAELQRRL